MALILLATPAALKAQFDYATNTDGVSITITGYSGPGGAVTIPTNINNLLVTCLGDGGNAVFGPNLTAVTIPDSVISFGFGAFDGCTSLGSIIIPASVTNIGELAFCYCPSLESIYFQGNAPNIGVDVFLYDNATIYYVSGTVGWSSPFGGLPAVPISYTFTTNAGTLTITGYSGPGGAASIPAAIYGLSVTAIESHAFFDCTNLASITIPGTVTNIGDNAFEYCFGLTNVIISNGVASIGDYAFYYCTGLASVSIPGSITNIAAYAYYYCTNLTSLYFGGNAPSVGSSAFFEDINATAYYFSGTTGWSSSFYNLPAVSTTALDQFDYSTNDGTITIISYSGPGGSVIIPTVINGLFVNAIAGDAFNACTTLSSVIIPLSVTSIGPMAFYGCTSLISVTIPDSVISIGYWAFYDCVSLPSVTIPGSVTAIGDSLFAGCARLTAITVDSNNPALCSVNGVLFNISRSTLLEYPDGISGSYTLSDGVTSIEDLAFYDCTSLTSITISDTVTNIPNGTFLGCSDLKDILVDGENPVYSSLNGVLFDKSKTTVVAYPTGLPGSYTIPSSVTSIDDSAFAGCLGLSSVTIPSSVTSIDDFAFAGCLGLSSITITAGVTNMGEGAFDGCNNLTNATVASGASIGTFAFEECPNLTSVAIADGVTSIGLDAFWNCGLTSVTIPDSVTNVGQDAFGYCTSLTNVTIANGVTGIAEDAFAYCYGLTSVTVPGIFPNFGNIFYLCRSLTSLTIANGATNIGQSTFSGCTGLTSVTIPASVINIGDGAFGDCTGLTRVYFAGNSPAADSTVFAIQTWVSGGPYGFENVVSYNATVYYLPGTTGWGTTCGGAPTALWLLPYPLILNNTSNFGVQNNSFGFTISWATNMSVVIEACTNLAAPEWFPLTTNILTNGSSHFNEPLRTSTDGRFYRIMSL
jgi:hypothetical protein